MPSKLLLFAGLLAGGLLAAAQQHHIPEQPIPFSHRKHAAVGLKCAVCHTNPDPGDVEGIPAASKCMLCHASIAVDAPAIHKLKQYADAKQKIPWARVYQVPSFVEFRHRTHLGAGATCETCHGPVAQRDALWKETDMSMGGCIACHRKNKASTECTTCHEMRQ